jgi:hypothetical protein
VRRCRTQAEYPDLDWASVNAGDTPMHVAAAKGSIEAIRILLKGFVSGKQHAISGRGASCSL